MLRRRTLLQGAAAGGVMAAGGAGAARAQLVPAVAPTADERAVLNGMLEATVRKHGIPGASVAIAASGRIVYQHTAGYADRSSRETLTSDHLFRIADLSHPITAAAIFTLVEQGKLRLDETVFGPGSRLGSDFGAPPYAPFVEEISIEHLLTHTAGGWRSDLRTTKWPKTANDPLFAHAEMSRAELIAWTIKNVPLVNPPGRVWLYSTFGYCLLGRVIEKVTGQSYESFVRSQILERCGLPGIRIGGSTRAERAAGEVVYHSDEGYDPYDIDLPRMDSHCGWIASPSDVVRFLTHVDGFPNPPDVLQPDTLRVMNTGSKVNPAYAKGWFVNFGNRHLHGGLYGSTGGMSYRTTGIGWVTMANGRRYAEKKSYDGDLHLLPVEMVKKVKAWSQWR
ncbi:MAG: beta-lactamase family protein [Alphaproteobacteria bacterium]|nr:beta-lactamase family protein [Alphaproteobacteria bacterium]